VVVDVLAGVAGLGRGITLALGVAAESAGSLRAAGGAATAAGRLAGLAAAYAMVVVVVLVARFAPLERAVGQDRLVGWHRRLGPWPLYLLCGHAVLITVGYAQAAHDGVLHQLGQLLWTYPGILASAVGFVALIAAGVTSYRLARRRMAYETWWSVHLYTYLALFLSFSHQVDTGASFVGHPVARTWWTALWIGTLALVVVSRVGLPLWRSLRHRVTVVGVQPAGPDTYSVILTGRRLDRLPVAGGQFLQWRFLRRGLWWQAHPYSLSAAPTARHLRITIKDLGDQRLDARRPRPGRRGGRADTASRRPAARAGRAPRASRARSGRAAAAGPRPRRSRRLRLRARPVHRPHRRRRAPLWRAGVPHPSRDLRPLGPIRCAEPPSSSPQPSPAWRPS
jgi:DMSO/TMAO reductase YedYZ heme-binding membrane subunit